MDMFLSNHATFPISRYQQEVILDKDVSYSKWKKQHDIYPPIFDRDIIFVHPLNNTVGPSQAKTNRHQSFQRFGALGATLQNITIVNGVPGADCFRVEDRWTVESLRENTIQLTVTFQIVFTKRTMFKPIIQKNVTAETKKWFYGYAKFLRQALQEDDKKEGVPSQSLNNDMEVIVDADEAPTLFLPTNVTGVGIGIAFLFLFVLFCQLIFLQQAITRLQGELVSMRAEQQSLVSAINEIAQQCGR